MIWVTIILQRTSIALDPQPKKIAVWKVNELWINTQLVGDSEGNNHCRLNKNNRGLDEAWIYLYGLGSFGNIWMISWTTKNKQNLLHWKESSIDNLWCEFCKCLGLDKSCGKLNSNENQIVIFHHPSSPGHINRKLGPKSFHTTYGKNISRDRPEKQRQSKE